MQRKIRRMVREELPPFQGEGKGGDGLRPSITIPFALKVRCVESRFFLRVLCVPRFRSL
jgi:hypothetical protein